MKAISEFYVLVHMGVIAHDLIACSFGIVIWEILMQKKPYAGKYEHFLHALHLLNVY